MEFDCKCLGWADPDRKCGGCQNNAKLKRAAELLHDYGSNGHVGTLRRDECHELARFLLPGGTTGAPGWVRPPVLVPSEIAGEQTTWGLTAEELRDALPGGVVLHRPEMEGTQIFDKRPVSERAPADFCHKCGGVWPQCGHD